MSNFFNQVKENINQSESLVKTYLSADSHVLKQEIFTRVESSTLQIMLYGAYNAGKSTLINALLGKEKARVNDIPTTDSIDYFDWNGYHLLDTPGVNAPIAHEQTTLEQIKRSSVMLFVIREGDQDAKDVYVRLFDMLKQNKKIFIVLNHQLTNLDDKAQAYNKILSILLKLAPENGISDEQIKQIYIFAINLKTALTGRLKQNEKLIAHSGFSEFLQAFDYWVAEQKTQAQLLLDIKSLAHNIWYTPALKKAADGGENSAELKAANADLQNLISEHNLIKMDARNLVTTEVTKIKGQISQLIGSCGGCQSSFDSSLQHILAPCYGYIETWLTQQFSEISPKLMANISHALEQNSTDDTNPILDKLGEIFKNQIGKEGNLKQALLYGRELKIPGIKGRWEKTLGNWAGKAAIVIQVVTFLWDAFNAHKEQERANQAQRQQAIAEYQATQEICSAVINELVNSVNQCIESAFSEPKNTLNELIRGLSENDSKQKQEYNLLQQYRNALDAISL